MAISFHNPKTVSFSGKYSLAAEVPAGTRLLYVSGQVGTAPDGKLPVGFDAPARVYGDMFDLGILDPVKVTRVALENAVSVAALMLTTESVVGELPLDPSRLPIANPGMEDMTAGMF